MDFDEASAGRRNYGLAVFLWLIATGGIAFAQSNPCHSSQPISILGSQTVAQAPIVFDPNQNVCWLANANLAADAAMQATLGVSGINPNGSMDFASAQKWVAALNAFGKGAGYLGHNNWQLPVTAMVDKTCADTGTFGGSFGPQCTTSALGNLFTEGLGLVFPGSVAPIFSVAVGPMHNLKESYYWTVQNNGGTSGTSNGGQEVFSFSAGIQAGVTINDNYFYVLPMVAGAIGTAPVCPAGAGVVAYTSGPAAGNAVYDCKTGYTWAANANLAATNNFGIAGSVTTSPPGRAITVPKISGGAMLFDTATQWIQAMNAGQYLGSSAWEMPADSKVLQALSTDLNLTVGDSRLMWTGSLEPFENLQPFFYWACERDQLGTSESPCIGYAPPDGSSQLQWSFNLDSGFQPTSAVIQKFFVMVYYPVTGVSGPVISFAGNAEGESGIIAPNTWVELKGANLSNTQRMWGQPGDFGPNNTMLPTSLDGVSVTVNGKAAYVYYVSGTQVNILTPPDALPTLPAANVNITVTNNGQAGPAFAVQAQPLSASLFVFDGTHTVAQHFPSYTDVGPATLFPGLTTPAQPGETILVYANGFGPTSTPVVSGSLSQSGSLATLPDVRIGGLEAAVGSANLIGPGLFQFNVTIPLNAPMEI